jgi:NAD(P)-dependent dehydrogenase (short-subunit alcohol dehydrogenase family)
MTVAGPAAPPARRFGNTVSLVTGAGGGIGGAIAERLAAEGSRVIVCDVDAAAADAVAAGLAAAAAHQRHRTRIRAAQRPGVRRCPRMGRHGLGRERTGPGAARLPLHELTPPEDVAEMIVFLASGRSRHTTGATIDITGADYVR